MTAYQSDGAEEVPYGYLGKPLDDADKMKRKDCVIRDERFGTLNHEGTDDDGTYATTRKDGKIASEGSRREDVADWLGWKDRWKMRPVAINAVAVAKGDKLRRGEEECGNNKLDMGLSALSSPSQKNLGMHGTGGYNKRYCHFRPTLSNSITFYIYYPPSTDSQKFLVLYWWYGLTCSAANFIIKSEDQRADSVEGVALFVQDTSPRGLNVEEETGSWDFRVGAGFFLNATKEKWKNWRMYADVVNELPKLLTDNFQQPLLGQDISDIYKNTTPLVFWRETRIATLFPFSYRDMDSRCNAHERWVCGQECEEVCHLAVVMHNQL
ncbi:S-formylglutathione hydrolase [Nymphaea thermarum]|nr:S-formylglutathione hydrolase [Nymphaea thermarum]